MSHGRLTWTLQNVKTEYVLSCLAYCYLLKSYCPTWQPEWTTKHAVFFFEHLSFLSCTENSSGPFSWNYNFDIKDYYQIDINYWHGSFTEQKIYQTVSVQPTDQWSWLIKRYNNLLDSSHQLISLWIFIIYRISTCTAAKHIFLISCDVLVNNHNLLITQLFHSYLMIVNDIKVPFICIQSSLHTFTKKKKKTVEHTWNKY